MLRPGGGGTTLEFRAAEFDRYVREPDTAAAVSSRRRTREGGTFVRDTPGSRSLERGLAIIRAFRLDAHSLTNAEIAAITGLARTTVSRPTRSLVEGRFSGNTTSRRCAIDLARRS